MRIISGKHKGRRLNAPKNLPVRPTTDMAKEALFNILNNHYYFGDLEVLELFAGTGNISYEFASRGTKHVTCVDSDSGCIQFITKISTELDLDISTKKADVFMYLENSGTKKYDLIFADPPYDMSLTDLARIQELVFKNALLKENGQLIMEHSKQLDLSAVGNFMSMRKYGSSVFSFFE